MAFLAQDAMAQSMTPVDCLQRLLERDPQLRVQRTTAAEQRALAIQQEAPFDLSTALTIQAGTDHSPVISPLGIVFPEVTTGQYQLSVTKQLPIGLSLGASLGVQSTTITDGASQDIRPQNRALYGLNATLPLLRNRGAAIQRAQLDQALLLVDAADADLHHVLNVRATDALTSWLNFWYTKRLLDVATAAMLQADSMAADMERFVAADRKTRSDLLQSRATALQRRNDAITARQNFLAARYQLAAAIGDAVDDAPQYPTPSFLDLPSDTLEARRLDAILVRDQSKKARPDLRALASRRDAARRFVESLASASSPQLDLGINIGANGFNFREGVARYTSPYTENVTPLNISASLTWAFPIENSSARGAAMAGEAQADRATIQEQDALRTIGLSATMATEALHAAEQRLAVAREGLDISRKVYDDEVYRFRHDASTLVQLRILQDNVIAAETAFINAKRDYYAAVIQIRFLTSTFFRREGSTLVVSASDVLTLPELSP